MALFEREFASEELPQGEAYELVPAGWYSACISEAGLASNKSGTGEVLKIKFTILGPTHEGRVIFGNLNIKNQSQKAEEIALQDLRAIMESIALSRVKDTDQLIGGNLRIKVTKVAANGDYAEKNEVRGYKPIDGSFEKKEKEPSRETQKKKTPW